MASTGRAGVMGVRQRIAADAGAHVPHSLPVKQFSRAD